MPADRVRTLLNESEERTDLPSFCLSGVSGLRPHCVILCDHWNCEESGKSHSFGAFLVKGALIRAEPPLPQGTSSPEALKSSARKDHASESQRSLKP